jgi:hypothetical protein
MLLACKSPLRHSVQQCIVQYKAPANCKMHVIYVHMLWLECANQCVGAVHTGPSWEPARIFCWFSPCLVYSAVAVA